MAVYKKLALGALLLLVVLPLGLVLLKYRQAICYYQVRKLQRESPSVALVPKPLADYTPNSGPSMTLSRFGYEFELPWTEVDRIDDKNSLTLIVFKSGQTVLFFDPKTQPDMVALMRKQAESSGRGIEEVFGEDTMSSNYQLEKAILNLTPEDISLFMPAKDAIRDTILLHLKFARMPNKETSLFSLQTPHLRGFQIGDPASGRTTLTLFDEQDRDIEFMIGVQSKTNGQVTQADVNKIVASLRPNPGPPQGKMAQKDQPK